MVLIEIADLIHEVHRCRHILVDSKCNIADIARIAVRLLHRVVVLDRLFSDLVHDDEEGDGQGEE